MHSPRQAVGDPLTDQHRALHADPRRDFLARPPGLRPFNEEIIPLDLSFHSPHLVDGVI